MRKPRSDKDWKRVYHSIERVYFVSVALGCCVPDCRDLHGCEGHHIIGGGMGRKSEYVNIIPLCLRHHRQIHGLGKQTFAERHRFDLERAAKRTQGQWEEHGEVYVSQAKDDGRFEEWLNR